MMRRRLRLQLLLALFVSFSWLSVSCDEAPAIPEVVIDGAPAVVYIGEAFELHASAEPLEGVSYDWRWSVPECAADVDPADSARVSVTPAAAGVLSLRVRVSDEVDSSRYSEATASFRVVPKLSKEITEIVLADVLPASSIPASGSSSAVEWKVSDEGLNGESSAWLAANVSISGGVLLLRDGSNPPEDGVFEVQAYRDGAPIEGVRISIALRHTHVFGENFQRDGSHHWHAALCGHDLTTLKEPHDWGDGFVCYTCGSRHDHSWSGWIPDSNDLSLHVRTSLCGHFPEESAPHVLTAENGYVCPDCGYSHAHSFEEAWSHDGSSHWHASSCGHPVRSEEQAHSYGEDWVCSACGFHHEHEADLSRWISNASSHWRIAPCHSGVRLLEQAHSYDADWNCI